MQHRVRYLSFLLAAALTTSVLAAPPDDLRLRRGVADPYPTASSAELAKRFEIYREAGIGIFRTDIGWRGHETENGEWQDSSFPAYLTEAIQAGFLLKANIGAMAGPPDWFFKQHPDAQMVNEDGLKSFNVISYWYPGLTSLLEDKDDHVFQSLSRLGLLKGIAYVVVPLGPAGEPLYPVPWTTTEPNKPIRFWFYDTHAQADFPLKMKAKYGTVDAANKAWGTNYSNWDSVKIPTPGTRPGEMWRDVLDWYRNTKRDFITWQVAHYKKLLAKYYPGVDPPRILILVPGSHITPFQTEQAVRTGDGTDSIKMMADSEFLLDLAHRENTYLQYTGIPNMSELEYLESYMRRHNFDVPLWGENAGNKGDPEELDEEILSNGLYGQEYIGSNLVGGDHVTPTDQYQKLHRAHAWLGDIREHRKEPRQTFDYVPIVQGGCIYGDVEKKVALCLQDDANLVLRKDGQPVWSSNTALQGAGGCSMTGDPDSTCSALFQGDGNFVVKRGSKALWSSNTGQRGKHFLLTGRTPYVAISDANDQIIWKAVQ